VIEPFPPESNPDETGENHPVAGPEAGGRAEEAAPDSLPGPENAPVEEEATEEIPSFAPDPDKLLCALLFASQEYQNARQLREILGEEWDTPRLRQLVKGLNHSLEASGMPFEVIEVEGTFRLRTLAKYFPWIRRLFKEPPPRRLSQAALETLAIVAYKQPITKAEVESIRGVNVDGSLKTLLDKKLIDIGRRSEAMGHAFTYHTTRDFMRYFGISRVPDDLPRLSEFEGILNAQALLPQVDAEGQVRQATQPEPDAEQMSLGEPIKA
jgi:segregation and condensation protein B